MFRLHTLVRCPQPTCRRAILFTLLRYSHKDVLDLLQSTLHRWVSESTSGKITFPMRHGDPVPGMSPLHTIIQYRNWPAWQVVLKALTPGFLADVGNAYEWRAESALHDAVAKRCFMAAELIRAGVEVGYHTIVQVAESPDWFFSKFFDLPDIPSKEAEIALERISKMILNDSRAVPGMGRVRGHAQWGLLRSSWLGAVLRAAALCA